MIVKIILGIIILDLILNFVLFLMKLYERKLDKDINNIIKGMKYKGKQESNTDE